MHPLVEPPSKDEATHVDRGCGVFLHLSSLPGGHGCGDLGANAREFADRLAQTGQRYWQLLPLNPTTGAAGDSPYFSNSAHAGNPLLISLHDLIDEGLLWVEELPAASTPDTLKSDFDEARALKLPLLKKAVQRVIGGRLRQDFEAFCKANVHWLDDHALFTAVRAAVQRPWINWPASLRQREPHALASALSDYGESVTEEKCIQYLFHRQWQRFHDHCAANGVELLGDLPIYVNYDSADVWANPQVFLLDETLRPSVESGVPPDYFSATGQLWRNPLYNWEHLESTNFDWWVTRIAGQLTRFDLLRIDHFRGLRQYWEVPAGAETAIHGQWRDVPSRALFDTLRLRIQPLPLVAEDLGTITPDVIELRERYDLPGMIVLQFAFGDDNHDNPYIPENHAENSIAYLGTHDNNTARGWLEGELDEAAHTRLKRYLGETENAEISTQVQCLIGLLLSSRARRTIVCAQDLLALPASARMNTPGLEAGNWHWQLSEKQFADLPLAWLGEQCKTHARAQMRASV